jgi:hypothetical protein
MPVCGALTRKNTLCKLRCKANSQRCHKHPLLISHSDESESSPSSASSEDSDTSSPSSSSYHAEQPASEHTCPICLETTPSQMIVLECNHGIHKTCLQGMCKFLCPYCQADIRHSLTPRTSKHISTNIKNLRDEEREADELYIRNMIVNELLRSMGVDAVVIDGLHDSEREQIHRYLSIQIISASNSTDVSDE